VVPVTDVWTWPAQIGVLFGDLAAWCAQYGYDGAQLRPGQIFADIRERTAGLSLGATVRDISVLQGVFNVVLFVPWGILVRRYLGWGLLASAASALGRPS
jgi:hypothetical protein